MRAKNFAVRQSGRSCSTDGRLTPPAITSSSTPLACRMRNPSPAAPSLTQACGTDATAAGSAEPSKAMTKKGRSSARQASMTREGNSPAPARIPSFELAPAIGFGLNEAAGIVGADEPDEIAHRAHLAVARGGGVDALDEGAGAVFEQHLIGAAQGLNVLAREAAALQSHDVEADQTGPVAHHHTVGNYVALDASEAADHRMCADAGELMRRREPGEKCVVTHRDVTREEDVVRHDDMVAEMAVMGDVGSRHEQAIVSHPRHHAAAGSAGVHGDMLADDVAAADHQGGILALVFQVLRLVADRGERENPRAGADAGAAGDDDVGEQLDLLAQLDLGADDAIRSDAGAGGEARP